MTRNSDGEQTQAYAPPLGGVGWAGGHVPPSSPPQQPGWSAPPPAGWHQTVPPAPVAPSRSDRAGWRWVGAGVVALAVIGAVLGVRMTMRDSTPAATPSVTLPGGSPSQGSAGEAGPTTSTSALAPAEPALSSADLPGLLSSATTLTSLLVVEHLVQVADVDAIYTATSTDRPDCGGAINVGLPAAYDGSGYTAVRMQEYHDVPGDQYGYGVTEAVSTFPSGQQAQSFVTTEAGRWAKCKYKPVTLIPNGTDDFVYTVLAPETNAGVLTVSTLSKDHSGMGCQRALSARRNVVIDVQICSLAGSAQAPALVAHIADRIPTN